MVARWLTTRRFAARAGVVHVTSLANPIVKEIRGLALAKNRRTSRLFVAEGLKLVADAIEAGWQVRTLVHATKVGNEALVERLSAVARVRGADIVSVSEAVLAKIARRDNPQAVIGVFEQRLARPGEIRPAPATSTSRSRRSATPAISAPSSARSTRWVQPA